MHVIHADAADDVGLTERLRECRIGQDAGGGIRCTEILLAVMIRRPGIETVGRWKGRTTLPADLLFSDLYDRAPLIDAHVTGNAGAMKRAGLFQNRKAIRF